jgi:predicted Zn-dependent protease
MHVHVRIGIFILILLMIPNLIMAQNVALKVDELNRQADLTTYMKSIEILIPAIQAAPDDFELWWRLARARQNYADMAASRKIPGWKEICVEQGHEAMKAGKKAAALRPAAVEGYYYTGCSAGTVCTGSSQMAILKEGLLKEIRVNLEKAYNINRYFDNGGPIQALASYYMDVPGFAGGDMDKAEKLARESMRVYPNDPAGRTIMAEILIKKDKRKNISEIRTLLSGVAGTPKTAPDYLEIWVVKARRLLQSL